MRLHSRQTKIHSSKEIETKTVNPIRKSLVNQHTDISLCRLASVFRAGLPPHQVEKAESSSKNAEESGSKNWKSGKQNGNVRFCRLFEFCIVLWCRCRCQWRQFLPPQAFYVISTGLASSSCSIIAAIFYFHNCFNLLVVDCLEKKSLEVSLLCLFSMSTKAGKNNWVSKFTSYLGMQRCRYRSTGYWSSSVTVTGFTGHIHRFHRSHSPFSPVLICHFHRFHRSSSVTFTGLHRSLSPFSPVFTHHFHRFHRSLSPVFIDHRHRFHRPPASSVFTGRHDQRASHNIITILKV